MSLLLNNNQLQQFIYDGFIKIENAFSKDLSAEALNILWNDIPFERNDPSTWNEPVIRLGMYAQQPFIDSLNSKELHKVFDQLVGERWIPCMNVGTFPVRFPSLKQPADTGKHVDVSFPGNEPSNYFEWRSNIFSKGRALLMLVLYSDVSENDAPTILYKGSHVDVARLLKPHCEKGLSFMEIANRLNELPVRDEVLATGEAGTVYLCHPFLVHAAQAHHGNNPKFMAQPPLLLRGELTLIDGVNYYYPVEQAIRLAF